ncbi:glycolate oxidase [Xylariaceae sp. FL0016]|nr:glycolate oxidase [Xylariaceae sp. FL0016]
MVEKTYTNPEYQAAHEETFAHPLDGEVEVVLPPGITRQKLDDALKEIADAIGRHAVFSGADLKDYVDPYEIPEAVEQRKIPCAAACPSTVEELQRVLKVANDYIIPVWTFSRGKNLGYGGPAPIVPGSLALDLHRMDKIIEVNEKLAFAVVEPGVTFGDLYKYCESRKLKLWPSTPSLGWGSVIGNVRRVTPLMIQSNILKTLDRGMGFVPTGVHHENMAGLEIVLANGELVRTGQFAKSAPESTPTSAHLTRLSFGPSIDGLFIQSNLGIVTKMGIWLTPQPQAYMAVTFDMPEFDDLEFLVDLFGSLRRNGTIPTTVFIGNLVGQTTVIHKHADWWDGKGPIPEWRLKEIQKELGIGYWVAKFGLYGAPEILQAQYNVVEKVLAKEAPTGHLRNTLYSGSPEDGGLLEASSVPGPHGGVYVGFPGMINLKFVDYLVPKDGAGVGGHGAYSPILPLDGKTVLDWAKAARQVYEAHGFDLISDFFIEERHSVSVCMLFFDKTDQAMRVAMDKLMHGLFDAGAKRGLAKYRSHIAYMDMTANLFDFNNHAYRRFVETLKDSVDPNGILSPGKMGIWPERFRKQRQEES